MKSTKHVGLVVTLDLHLEGARFELLPTHWLSWQSFFLVLLSPSRQILGYYLDYVTTASFQIFSNSLSSPPYHSMVYNLNIESAIKLHKVNYDSRNSLQCFNNNWNMSYQPWSPCVFYLGNWYPHTKLHSAITMNTEYGLILNFLCVCVCVCACTMAKVLGTVCQRCILNKLHSNCNFIHTWSFST
jgi:hypothetical protein